MRKGRTRKPTGFTLVEVIFTIVLLGVFATFATMKLLTPATMTLSTQAQSLADVLRRAQSLAVVRGERTRVTASAVSGSVAVTCPASAPCNTDTSITVRQGAVLNGASGVYFNSLGQPVDSAGVAWSGPTDFTLGYATEGTYKVSVAPLTGRVSVCKLCGSTCCP